MSVKFRSQCWRNLLAVSEVANCFQEAAAENWVVALVKLAAVEALAAVEVVLLQGIMAPEGWQVWRGCTTKQILIPCPFGMGITLLTLLQWVVLPTF